MREHENSEGIKGGGEQQKTGKQKTIVSIYIEI